MTNPPDRPVHPSERRGGRRPRFRVLAAGTAAAAILLTAGCSNDDGDDDSASTTTIAETTTTAPESTLTATTEPRTPEEEVEEAYWEAERVLDDLLQDPDPDDPRLAETRVDPSLSHVSELMGDLIDEGVAADFPAGEPKRAVISVEVNNETATVVSCDIDTSVTVDADSREVLDDSVGSAVVETTVERVDGVWLVSDSITTQEWIDGLGCDR